MTLAVPRKHDALYRRILIVVDDTPAGQAALDEGLAIAKQVNGEVLFSQVMQETVLPLLLEPPLVLDAAGSRYREEVEQGARRRLADAQRQAHDRGVPSQVAAVWGSEPATCIAEEARKHSCELIVIGSRDRHPIHRVLFGSVAARLVRLAPVALLVCKVHGIS